MRRVKIYRDDELVGTIPQPTCAPHDIVEVGTAQHLEPTSVNWHEEFFYQRVQFRTDWRYVGDWMREAVLIADYRTGDGDLEALHGFLYDDAYVEEKQKTRRALARPMNSHLQQTEGN